MCVWMMEVSLTMSLCPEFSCFLISRWFLPGALIADCIKLQLCSGPSVTFWLSQDPFHSGQRRCSEWHSTHGAAAFLDQPLCWTLDFVRDVVFHFPAYTSSVIFSTSKPSGGRRAGASKGACCGGRAAEHGEGDLPPGLAGDHHPSGHVWSRGSRQHLRAPPRSGGPWLL